MANKRQQNYLKEALEAAATDDILFAVWMIENVIESRAPSRDISRIIEVISSKMSSTCFEKSKRTVTRELNTVIHLCQYSESLLEEEWMLIVTNLSTAFSLKRFSERIGRPVVLDLLQPAMDAVDEVTHHFSDPGFRAALHEARGRYPNPLPPPL